MRPWLVAAGGLGAALVGFAARPSGAFPHGPPPGRTGGFGEPTCQTCHIGAGLNVDGDGLRLDSLPRKYVPGTTYRLSVFLSRRDMGRAGFQLAVRFARGDEAGRQAGQLAPHDSLTQWSLFAARAVQYLGHTQAGSALVAPDTARWTFDWTAPAEGGEVVFHVAANAANNDDSERGDHIYMRQFRVQRQR